MINTRLDAGFPGVTALLMTCVGCTSLQDLSSYSAGSPDAASPGPFQAPVGQSPDDGFAPGPDAGSSSVAEAQTPAGLPLLPGDTGNTADDCTGPGEFSDSDSTACYLLDDTTSSWRDARDRCQAWGGDLAQVESAEENTLLSEHSADDAWLGASDFQDEGNFRWVDGDEVDAEGQWGPGQPDNFEGRENCLELREADDRWNDVPCMSPKLAVCERAF